jgi:hypothetical protein
MNGEYSIGPFVPILSHSPCPDNLTPMISQTALIQLRFLPASSLFPLRIFPLLEVFQDKPFFDQVYQYGIFFTGSDEYGQEGFLLKKNICFL